MAAGKGRRGRHDPLATDRPRTTMARPTSAYHAHPSLPARPSVTVHCTRCEAVCCRLTVTLLPSDRVPSHYIAVDEQGTEVMAQNEDGWCVAVDTNRLCCTIYENRPALCREFEMGGAFCVDVRGDYARMRGIPVVLTT